MARTMVTAVRHVRAGSARSSSAQSAARSFLGRDMGHQRDYSEEVAGVVDDEVRDADRDRARRGLGVLIEYRDVLDQLVLELIEKETLTKDELAAIFADVRKRPSGRSGCPASAALSDIPPVLTPPSRALADGPTAKACPQRARPAATAERSTATGRRHGAVG